MQLDFYEYVLFCVFWTIVRYENPSRFRSWTKLPERVLHRESKESKKKYTFEYVLKLMPIIVSQPLPMIEPEWKDTYFPSSFSKTTIFLSAFWSKAVASAMVLGLLVTEEFLITSVLLNVLNPSFVALLVFIYIVQTNSLHDGFFWYLILNFVLYQSWWLRIIALFLVQVACFGTEAYTELFVKND